MKLAKMFTVLLALTLASSGYAHDHHHVKHNMVLFGTNEIFASHIVYKQPHNYQVILKLKLHETARATYLAEKAKFPQDQFIYLLSEMDIKNIETATFISGNFLRVDSTGARHVIAPNIELKREQFELIYFDELPLSLSP